MQTQFYMLKFWTGGCKSYRENIKTMGFIQYSL